MGKRTKSALAKETVEKMCRAAGMTIESRRSVKGIPVFICDGFSAKPHIDYRKFGANEGEFPFGAYLTIWWIERDAETFQIGSPMLFDAFHNPEYDIKTKKTARINTAIEHAAGFIERAPGVAKNVRPH